MLADFLMKPPNLIPKFPLILIFLLAAIAAVQSEPSVIRLPSDDDAKTDATATATVNRGICSWVIQGSCPVKCFRPDPVCGDDGVTYWCGCADAACAGARVAKAGYCEIGNGGSGPLSGQALLLVHIVWLIVLGFSVLFGLF